MSRDEALGITGIAILAAFALGAGAWTIIRWDTARAGVTVHAAPHEPATASVSIPPSVQAAAPGIVERREGTTVVGVVRNVAGEPVSGARVASFYFDGRPRSGAAARTGADGRFALEGVAPGAYTLRVESPEGLAVVDRLEVGAEGTRVLEAPIVVHSGASVEFQVRDSQGKGLEGVSVSVRQVVESGDRRGYALEVVQASSGSSGAARVNGLGDGSYEVRLAKEGFMILNDRFVVSGGRSEPQGPLVKVLQASR